MVRSYFSFHSLHGVPTKVQNALSIKRPCRRKRLRVEPDAQKQCCGCKFYQLHGIVTLYMLWSSRSLCPLRFLQRHGQILWSDIRIKCKTCLHTGCSPNYSFALSVYFANFLLGCCRPLSTTAKNGTHRSWPMTFSTGSFAQNLATWSHAGRCPISSCPSCWRAWPLRCRKLRNPSKSVWRYEIFRYLLISLRWWGTKRARWLDAVRTLLTPWFDVVTFRCSSVCKHQRGWVQYMWLLCTGKYMKHPKCIYMCWHIFRLV